MRTEFTNVRVRIRSLTELDALVAKHLTGEEPATHWEDSHAHCQFESVEEAMETMRDPYFQELLPNEDWSTTVLTEVKEFRGYSASIQLAWELVESPDYGTKGIRVRHDKDHWFAAVGENPESSGQSAPVAICLAALRARGVEAELLGADATERPVRTAATVTGNS